MRVLVIDVGGTHVKVSATGHKKAIEIPSGPNMTAGRMMVAAGNVARTAFSGARCRRS